MQERAEESILGKFPSCWFLSKMVRYMALGSQKISCRDLLLHWATDRKRSIFQDIIGYLAHAFHICEFCPASTQFPYKAQIFETWSGGRNQSFLKTNKQNPPPKQQKTNPRLTSSTPNQLKKPNKKTAKPPLAFPPQDLQPPNPPFQTYKKTSVVCY